MISHGLTIVINELKKHLEDAYSVPVSNDEVQTGNLAEGLVGAGNNGGVARDKLIFSMVNLKEEKALKNLPNYVRNDVTLRATYENPPVFLNFQILLTATHSNYNNALLVLFHADQGGNPVPPGAASAMFLAGLAVARPRFCRRLR